MEAPHIFQTRKCLKDGAEQKPRFLLCELKKPRAKRKQDKAPVKLYPAKRVRPRVSRRPAKGPVDPWPGERADHGWFAPVFQAQQDRAAQEGEPRTCQRSGTAKRSKDFSSILLVTSRQAAIPTVARWLAALCIIAFSAGGRRNPQELFDPGLRARTPAVPHRQGVET